MNAPAKTLDATERFAQLRREFDAGFATPAAETADAFEDLIAIGAGGDHYALRLSEIQGLHADVKVIPVPTPISSLLGIAAIQGVMAPVYDMAGLLGYPPAAAARWMVLVRAPQIVGLAFEQFEAHVRVLSAMLTGKEKEEGPQTRRCAQGAVRAAGSLRPILQIAAIVQLIRERTNDR